MTTIQRLTIAALLSIATPSAIGCASAPSTSVAPTSPPANAPAAAPAIPSDLRAEVERAEQLGRQIYLYDKASAIGTDALVEQVKSLDGLGLGGYLTLLADDAGGTAEPAFAVLFYTAGEEPQIAYRIHIPVKAGAKATVQKLEPKVAPSESVRTLIRARQNAIAAPREIVQPMNPLVFPGHVIGEEGILVYLLAGTKRPRVAVLGRHYRVLMSPDGRTVRRLEPLSKTILEIPLTPPDPSEQMQGVVVSHLVTNAPLETHVFASLLYEIPIFVATARGTWRVADGRITYLGESSR